MNKRKIPERPVPLTERLRSIEAIKASYPIDHNQIPAINAQIKRIEALIEMGREY